MGNRSDVRRLDVTDGVESPDDSIKVLVFGPTGIGKTRLIHRHVDGEYLDTENVFYSCDEPFDMKVDYQSEHEGVISHRFSIWYVHSLGSLLSRDSKGDWAQESDWEFLRTRKMVASFVFPGTDIFLICLDLMNPAECSQILRRTFLPMSLSAIKYGPCPRAKIILVGTKSDERLEAAEATAEDEDAWTRERFDRFVADSLAVEYLECSAKTGEGVEEVFRSALEVYCEKSYVQSTRKKASFGGYMKSMIGIKGKERSQTSAIDPPIIVPPWTNYDYVPGPCFAGHSRIRLANGRTIRLRDLKKGEVVRSRSGSRSRVLCVIKTICRDGFSELVPVGIRTRSREECLPWITSWHPLRLDASAHFVFPAQTELPEVVRCSAVYNLVLESNHVVEVNGFDCVTWGHLLKGPVVEHSYFGTRAVVRDLEKMRGWEEGHVVLGPSCVVRDPSTGLVCALQQLGKNTTRPVTPVLWEYSAYLLHVLLFLLLRE